MQELTPDMQLTPEIASFFDWIFTVYKENGIDYSDIGRWRAYGSNCLYDYRSFFPMKGSCLIFTKTFGQMKLLGYTNYGYWHTLCNNSQKLQKWDTEKQALAKAFDSLNSQLQFEKLPTMTVDCMFGATENEVIPFYIVNRAYHFPLVPL
jgi:hypothetical protein